MQRYLSLIIHYQDIQHWRRLNLDEIRRRQLDRFRRLFEHAREHSPFYRQLYRDAGIEKLVIRTFADLERVPVVDKAMMRAHATEDLLTRPLTEDLLQTTTSGSTGEPFVIYQTKGEQYTSHVRVLAMLRELGYLPWDRILMLTRLESEAVLTVERDLSLFSRLRRVAPLFRREILSIYTHPEEIFHWLDARRSARVFWSTPGIVEILCDYLEKNGIRFDFELLILTSETLSSAQRARFAACLGGRVVSHYGTMECPTIGFDSGRDANKRIFSNFCLMELINIEAREGLLQGSPVISNLVNYTMPFIRFNTHDSAVVLDDADCPTKVIGPILGRLDDVLTLPSGAHFAHHHAHALFMDFVECLQFKFVQYPFGLVALRLSLHKGADRRVVEEEALKRWRQHFPGEELAIEFVDPMPVDAKTGKFKNIEKLAATGGEPQG
jgi:phenylacetate-CoA ligase